MDSITPKPPVSLFREEVRLWLKSLITELPGSTLTETQRGAFLIDNPSKSNFRIILKYLSNSESLHTLPGPGYGPTEQVTDAFTLWEDVWFAKKKIVQSRLRAQVGLTERIPARMTQVRRLDRLTTLHFLQNNHLQDPVLSKYKYGLFLPQRYFRVLRTPPPAAEELLVAVATFARPRTFTRHGLPHQSYELVRFANLLNMTVVGGMDKLMQYFVRQHQPNDIMTYVDLEGSTGQSYLKLGFEPHGDTLPLPFWVHLPTMIRYSPHRLPEGTTEASAPKHGYVKIQNGGSRKFVKVVAEKS